MINLKEEERSDFEQDLYEAKVEEALAKWEATKLFEKLTEDTNYIPKGE